MNYNELVKALDLLTNTTEEFTNSVDELKGIIIKSIKKGSFNNKKDDSESDDEPNNKSGYLAANAIERIATNLKYDNPFELANLLDNMLDIYPSACISLVLREIAIIIDERYKDNIRNCDEYYVLSSNLGRIIKISKDRIKSFKAVALFRTLEDAREACKALKVPLKFVYDE